MVNQIFCLVEFSQTVQLFKRSSTKLFNKMAPVVEPIGTPLSLGEGPFWVAETQSLYFVDVLVGSVHKYDTQTKEQSCVKTGRPCSLIIPVEGQKDKFVISQNTDLNLLTWNGESDKFSSNEFLVKIEHSNDGTKINDGKVDPAGRLWAGSMGPPVEGKDLEWLKEKGSLYRLSKDKSVSKVMTKVSLSNGLSWSLDKKRVYFIDSLKYRVDGYDYDDVTGSISNEKTVFDLKANNLDGFPDGMAIDLEGNLWVANFGQAQVLRINPTTGELLSVVKFPSLQITSLCFGGPNYDELYVTSANIALSEEQLAQYPMAGSCFRVTNLGVKGVPNRPVKL